MKLYALVFCRVRTLLTRWQQMGALSIKAWDLGGHEVVRELWADYFAEADAIVYMVDSADHERLEGTLL